MRRWLDMLVARQPMRRIVLDMGMHAAAGMVDFLPQMRTRQGACTLIEDVEYGRSAQGALTLDILKPDGPGPHPVLLYLHGGGFAIGSKRTHRALAVAYASHGYLVCNVDYRLAPEFPFPAALEDCCAAWLWAVEQVGAYGGDRHRIGIAGESAGANLALAIALACSMQRPEPFALPLFERGVKPALALLYYGFLQSSMPARYRRPGVSALAASIATDAARSYLGKFATHPTVQHALADPLCVIEAMSTTPGLPPVFIAAGLNDPVAADSQRLEQALNRLNSPCSARYYRGESHGFHVMFWRQQAIKCWRESFEFLGKYLPTTAS